MDGEITIAGHKEKKWVVYAAAGGGLIAVYYVWKNHQASTAAAAASSSSSGMITDPSTGAQFPANAQDPVTGETYSQEIAQYGSVEAADSAVTSQQSSYLGSSGDLYGTGYSASDYSTGTYGAVTTTSGSIYTSNSAWAQAATAGLTDIGYTGTDVATALGDYLTGAPVDTTQAAIIQTAIAEYGPAPVGSFQIIAQPAGSTTSASLVAVPNVAGDTLAAAAAAVQAAGLVFSGPSSGSTVASQSPAAGTQVQPGSTVTVTATAAQAAATAPAPAKAPAPSSTILTGGHVISANPGAAEVGWTIREQSPATTQIVVVINGPGKKNQTRSVPATATNASFSDLEPGHTYVVSVTPKGANGQATGGPNSIDLVTSKS